MRKAWFAIVVVFAFILAGCSSQTQKAAPNVGQAVQEKPEEQKAQEVGKAVETGKVTEEEFKEAKECELKEFPDIHFAFDKYDLNEKAKRILTEIAEYLKKCPEITVTIEGNCDERGSNEYNLALGWKRANEAKKFLVALGVDPSRIITISYGEEKPICFEHNEACWAKNRRDHFVFCKGTCSR